MFTQIYNAFYGQLPVIQFIFLTIQVILHIIFAGAVAKDSGQLSKLKIKPALVSGITWSFATLVGGVFVAVIYWFIHHSTLTRSHGIANTET